MALSLLVSALLLPASLLARPLPQAPLTPAQTQELVQRVLRTEIAATQDASHPFHYTLRKTSPRLSTTKLIAETRDGDVARLIQRNNAPLSPQDEAAEHTRLQSLLDDPSLQRHRQQREQDDSEHARKILRALPDAFLYSYAGTVDTPHGPSYRLSFQPNPSFDPPDIESQALKAMAGELWIDVAEQRVTHLEGHRLHDVDYMGGLLGKLEQGGTLLLDQADVGNHQWRTTRMVLVMNARILFKSIKLDTTLEISNYSPLPPMDYRQAIQLLESQPK